MAASLFMAPAIAGTEEEDVRPHLEVAPSEVVDFGGFDALEPQTREVWIRNTGKSELVVQKIFSGCPCTKVRFDHDPIAPGDSARMEIRFDGHDRKPGPVRKIVRITSNADNSMISLYINGRIERHFKR